MGASLVYLNEPNKDIEHEKGSNEYLAFAAGSMQGWRLNMVSHFPSCLPEENPSFGIPLSNFEILNFRRMLISQTQSILVTRKKLFSAFSTGMEAERWQCIQTSIMKKFWARITILSARKTKRNGSGNPF